MHDTHNLPLPFVFLACWGCSLSCCHPKDTSEKCHHKVSAQEGEREHTAGMKPFQPRRKSLFLSCDWCIQRMPWAHSVSFPSCLICRRPRGSSSQVSAASSELLGLMGNSLEGRMWLSKRNETSQDVKHYNGVSACVLLSFSFSSPGQGEPFQKLFHFMEANAKYITHCVHDIFHVENLVLKPKAPKVMSASS